MGFDLGQAVGGVIESGKQAVSGGVEAVKNAAEAAVDAAAAPTKVVVEVAQGKPIDQAVADVGQGVLNTTQDATGATVGVVAAAEIAQNAVRIDLARIVGGKTTVEAAQILAADKQYYASLAAAVAALLEKPAPPTAEELVTSPAYVLLAASILDAVTQLRQKAVLRPVPYMVKTLLAKVHSSETLEKAEWMEGKVGITLPEVINGTQDFMGNHKHAVTVDNIIVFSATPGQTETDLRWWAHELQHVDQYRRLGILEFSKEYVNDFQAIEREAEEKAAAL